VWQTHINREAAVDRTQHVDIVIEEVLKRRPTLIIVGNGVQTV
jgi:predicted methyltransferase MtxX (methanogen marker protein 4)